MARRDEISAYCDERLRAAAYQDVAINGVQVAGAAELTRLAVAVSASRRVIEDAAAWGAEALLVHHGLLWGGRLGPLTGPLGARLRALFVNDITLLAYHLPLDGHPELGNCAQLAAALGYAPAGRFSLVGAELLGVYGAREPRPLDALLTDIAALTGRAPTAVGDLDAGADAGRVGFLTGSGYGALAEVAAAGCRVLVTGDLRESSMAQARELGVVAIAAGHEATERLGAQALAADLAGRFGVETRWIADPNPI